MSHKLNLNNHRNRNQSRVFQQSSFILISIYIIYLLGFLLRHSQSLKVEQKSHDMSHSAKCDKLIKETKANSPRAPRSSPPADSLLTSSSLSSSSHQLFYPCCLFLYKSRWENTSLLWLDLMWRQSNPTLCTFCDNFCSQMNWQRNITQDQVMIIFLRETNLTRLCCKTYTLAHSLLCKYRQYIHPQMHKRRHT